MAIQVTEAEWKIMEVLWDHSPRTMGEITRILEPETGWTRHTVITLLKRMTEKGAVSVDDSERAKLYTPLISREEASTVESSSLVSYSAFEESSSLSAFLRAIMPHRRSSYENRKRFQGQSAGSPRLYKPDGIAA